MDVYRLLFKHCSNTLNGHLGEQYSGAQLIDEPWWEPGKRLAGVGDNRWGLPKRQGDKMEMAAPQLILNMNRERRDWKAERDCAPVL